LSEWFVSWIGQNSKLDGIIARRSLTITKASFQFVPHENTIRVRMLLKSVTSKRSKLRER